MKPQKQSSKILNEILKLYPFLEKSDIIDASDIKLEKLSRKFQEPRFLSYRIHKKFEKEEAKKKRSDFLQRKSS